jgi:protein O-mannosyl-transferase
LATQKSRIIASSDKRNRNGSARSFRWSALLVPAFVAFATFATFSPVLQNGFVNGDDPANVLDNPNFRGLGWTELRWMFTTFHLTLYRPLTWVSLGFDYVLWDMNPHGYHLTSLILHVASSALFYFISLRLLALATNKPASPDFWLRVSAGFAALIFALHPLRVEPVAWISARNDVLAGFFSLACILSYLKYAMISETHRLRWFAMATGAYVLSLLSKGSGVTLPIVLLMLDIYPLKRLKLTGAQWAERAIWFEKLPFVIPAIVVFVIGAIAKHQFDTAASLQDYGVLSRLNQIMYSLAFYISKTVIPLGLSPLYEKLAYLSEVGAFDIRSGLIVLALTAGFLLARKSWPAGLASWLCYAVILSPVLGVVPFGPQVVADRYSYLSCLGWALLAGAGLFHLRRRRLDGRLSARTFKLAGISGALILALLSTLSWRQSQVWHDSERLWRHALAIDRRTSFAHNLLGLALAERGEIQQAIEHFRDALRVDPAFAEAHNNLGYFLARQGSRDEAIAQFRQAILIKPAFADAHNNLGNALANRGQFNEAIQHLRRAQQLSPDKSAVFYNLARVLAQVGKMEEAIVQYQHALQLNPLDPDIHNNLGLILFKKGDTRAAIERFLEALRLNPGYGKANFNLGRVYAQEGDLDNAVRYFELALQVHPDVAEIHENLARVLEVKKEKEKALRHYQEALRLIKANNELVPTRRETR